MGAASGFHFARFDEIDATLRSKSKNSRHARKAKRVKILGKLRRRRCAHAFGGAEKDKRYLFSNFGGRLAMKAAMPSF